MANPTFAAIDVGTTKVCTVVAEVVAGEIRILGTGVGPSAGRGILHAAVPLERLAEAGAPRELAELVGGVVGRRRGDHARLSTPGRSG